MLISNHKTNFWTGTFSAIFALTLLLWVIPKYGGGGFSHGLPPQLVATIGAWVMLIFALSLCVQSLIVLVRTRVKLATVPAIGEIWRQVWPFLYTLFFIIAATKLPLTWIGPALIFGLLLILGERRWLVLLLTSVLPSIALYVLTVYLMKIGVV